MSKTISFRFQTADPSQYTEVHHEHMFGRLRILSYALVLLFPLFLYSDFTMLNDPANPGYQMVSIAIHSCSLFFALLFLWIDRLYKRNPGLFKQRRTSALLTGYVALCLFAGVTASLNSQHLTGNVDAYIIILLASAIVFPIKPSMFLLLVVSSHAIFLGVLTHVSHDRYHLLTKGINTTVTAIIAVCIAWNFYYYRRKDFLTTAKLQRQKQDFGKLFAINPYPLVLARLSDDKIMLMNAQAIDFYRLQDLTNGATAELLYPGPEEKLAIQEELQLEGSIKNRVFQLTVPSGQSRWVMLHYELIDYGGEPSVLAGITDITELKKVEEELALYAATDALTGVMNRGSGMAKLQDELQQAGGRNEELIVCFVDINDLKEVNDRYGHAEGDALISMASSLLKLHLDEKDYIFRYGGDEFILVLHKDMAEAARLMERVRQDLQTINNSCIKPFTITVSHGLFPFHPGTETSADTLIAFADQEMYKNKNLYKKALAESKSGAMGHG